MDRRLGRAGGAHPEILDILAESRLHLEFFFKLLSETGGPLSEQRHSVTINVPVTVADEDVVLERIDEEAIVDTDAAAPTGVPCDACGAPVESLDRFCTACAAPSPSFQGGPAETQQAAEPDAHFFRCQNCGAEVRTDDTQRSYVCPFCDSTYVAEFARDTASRQPPGGSGCLRNARVSPTSRSWCGSRSMPQATRSTVPNRLTSTGMS